MEEEAIVSKSESYYLPSDVSGWIEQQAKAENRSASNFLTTLIRRVRDSSGDAA
ncbi:MAG: hypothetical protein U0835_00270 [Isosphaeraceae bacterium]